MTNEQLRMQFIGGIITESEYKAKIEENKSPKSKKSLNENIVSIGAINNPFPKHKKSDYELAFEHFTKGGLNEEEGNPFKMGSNINTIEELEQALKSMFPNSQVTLNYDEEGDGVYIDGIYVSEGAYQKWDTYIEMTDEEKSFMDDKSLIMYLKSKMNLEETLEEIFGLGKKTKRNFETVISQLLADNKDAVEAIAAEQDPATKKQMADPLLKKAFAEFKKLKAEGADADVIGNMNEFKRELFGDSRSLLQKLAAGSSVVDAREGLERELEEAHTIIESLRSDLNEVNLLNAKLLYTNKVFKAKNLNESQKVKVLTAFDKATTVKETKLVYETLSEGLKPKEALRENLGRASKSIIPSNAKSPIIEDENFARMRHLAFYNPKY